jgi:hypothetical protein
MSTGQNGKGDKARNVGPRFKQNYDSIKWKQEYCVVSDDDGHWYVIPADKTATFVHWIAAMNGQRHFPADFEPIQIDRIEDLRFEKWREESPNQT